jgi:hypothetical protein
MKPVSTQTKINHPALPTLRVMSALTMKIPDPIIEPATTMVASSSPSVGLNVEDASDAVEDDNEEGDEDEEGDIDAIKTVLKIYSEKKSRFNEPGQVKQFVCFFIFYLQFCCRQHSAPPPLLW